MKINKGVGRNSIPAKVLKDYKSVFSKPLVTWSIFPLQEVSSPVPLKWQILFLFIRKVTSSTATIIDPSTILSNISKIFE